MKEKRKLSGGGLHAVARIERPLRPEKRAQTDARCPSRSSATPCLEAPEKPHEGQTILKPEYHAAWCHMRRNQRALGVAQACGRSNEARMLEGVIVDAKEQWLAILLQLFGSGRLLYLLMLASSGQAKMWLGMHPPIALTQGLGMVVWVLSVEDDGKGIASTESSVRGMSMAIRHRFGGIRIVATAGGEAMTWTFDGNPDGSLTGAPRRMMELALSTRPKEEQDARDEAYKDCLAAEALETLKPGVDPEKKSWARFASPAKRSCRSGRRSNPGSP
ncbi:hypothetical protein BDZ90DRAFT_106428 [Jaminaea rosea]|uniref:Uncharacterized protein n=1 Tax=Jaminaea rosea TaxID=1569628 RepID=A0A316UVQ4_9BASI|nr:hypothetical protein BDZ90DRAFT_106428 [Jaminaea rosea]PWN29359.1 hypothetical protein BDZ90DRAFT_106428 [Jaminaea rosea]